MEIAFMVGAIRVGIRKDISPIINKKILFKTIGIMTIFGILGSITTYHIKINYTIFFALATLFNGVVILISWPFLKQMARGLTVDETGQEIHPEESFT